MATIISPDSKGDKRAVSPVIGVILMVAITVILAAVIGTFVLGLGDKVSQSAPQASIQAEPVSGAGSIDEATTIDFVNLNHKGGDTIRADETEIKVEGPDGSGTIWDGSSAVSATVKTLSLNGNANNLKATFSAAPSDLSTAGSLTVELTAPDDGDAAAETGMDATGDYTVTLIDKPSGQIITEKNVEV